MYRKGIKVVAKKFFHRKGGKGIFSFLYSLWADIIFKVSIWYKKGTRRIPFEMLKRISKVIIFSDH